MMCTEEEKLHDFLSEIQLEQFYYLIVRNLHLTRIAHFDHVEEIDLTGIGMSKPEQRRLFDHLKKYKKPSIKKFFKVSYGAMVWFRNHFVYVRVTYGYRFTTIPVNWYNNSFDCLTSRYILFGFLSLNRRQNLSR